MVTVNLYFTDLTSSINYSIRHHCIYVPVNNYRQKYLQEILSYCFTESSPLSTVNRSYYPNLSFTFEQLAQQNITSQQLYAWSAPIDLAERYQHYLDEPDYFHWTTTDMNNVFNNCTWPRFGPSCEYAFIHLSPDTFYSSLADLVYDYYNGLGPLITLTCYTHMQCYRGPSPICLDWSEICDGRIDCQESGQDEDHCWQLEVNECEEDEFRCLNGQCIPKTCYRDNPYSPDCLDGSDEPDKSAYALISCEFLQPCSICEDVSCPVSCNYPPYSLTSSCTPERDILLNDIILPIRSNDVNEECWLAIICLLNFSPINSINCYQYCQQRPCREIIQKNCSKSIYSIPSVPILAGHLSFATTKEYLINPKSQLIPEYICFDDRFCDMIATDNTSFKLNSLTCYRARSIGMMYQVWPPYSWSIRFLLPTLQRFGSCAYLPKSYFNFCEDHPNLYRCMNTSKCISKHRLLDIFKDCFFGDDEDIEIVNKTIDIENNTAFFYCQTSNTFISSKLVNNGRCDCLVIDNKFCDDEYLERRYAKTHILFQTQCDGFTELEPIVIDGKSMTDETDCQEWLCDNVYTRCDKIWNCWDGRDEVNCNRSSPIDCPSNARLCASIETNKWSCLPVEKVNDGHIDCIGAMDERKICRQETGSHPGDEFHCQNDTMHRCLSFSIMCNPYPFCSFRDDQEFCRNVNKTEITEYFAENFVYATKTSMVYFSLVDASTRKQQSLHMRHSLTHPLPTTKQNKNDELRKFENRCYRGLTLQHWSEPFNSNITTADCLCPPSYYGQYCQFQNERVAVSLQFRALSDAWQTTFIIVAFLIDNTHQRHIHSAHQLTYLPFRDCQTKFNFYLLFSSRPKNASLNYSVHFDIFEQHSHQQRASYLAPIVFPFLPVYRLTLQLEIPRPQTQLMCHDLDCGKHGRCVRYVRVFHASSPSIISFCQCDEEWSGRLCTIPIKCSCSPRARCLGRLFKSDRSICLCPCGRFGSRCYLSNDHICDDDAFEPKCYHGGRCIPNDEHQQEVQQPFTCVCSRGFTGDRCEQQERQLLISFDSRLIDRLSRSMLIHFIRSYPDRRHENSTTFKHIPFNFPTISLFWSHPFHLMFVEFHRHQYYLAFIRPVFNQSEVTMETMIRSSDRCPHIRELFSSKMMQSHHLYRIKFYHQLCQSNNTMQQISCFYDDVHLCLCQSSPRNGDKREANCLDYDHGRKFDCLGQNGCENGGQCFQDDSTCPRTSICICAECSYGHRCQFTMDGFRLSLDAILGYHIQPGVALRQQPSIVRLAFVSTILMTLVGLLNGIFSLITFKCQKLRQVGCGDYLLGSSITTLLTMGLFMTKFSILLNHQIGSLSNPLFLAFQCRSVDYLLRVCLNLDHWFNACVSIERTSASLQGVKFNKLRSKKNAKHIIAFLCLIMFGSTLYDPVYRRLIEEKNDDEPYRVWCFVSYPKWLERLDLCLHMIYFNSPFLINIICGFIIAWQSARYRTAAHRRLPFRQVLKQKIREQKHILIGPCFIIIMSLPRLILAIVSGCMKSSRQSHLYLAGYFISFTPSMLIFVIFVWPSKLYRTEFQRTVRKYRNMFQLRMSHVHPLIHLN